MMQPRRYSELGMLSLWVGLQACGGNERTDEGTGELESHDARDLSEHEATSVPWALRAGAEAADRTYHTSLVPPTAHQTNALSSECLDWAEQQEPLALLALEAMKAFGRIDPGLYSVDPQTDEVSLTMGLVPSNAFQSAFDIVTQDVKGRHALASGLTAATHGCREGQCPANVYTFDVGRVDLGLSDQQLHAWNVLSSAPTSAEWATFLRLYSAQSATCPVPSSLLIESPSTGYGQTAGLFTQGDVGAVQGSSCGGGVVEKLTNPCKCFYAGAVAKTGSPCTVCPGY